MFRLQRLITRPVLQHTQIRQYTLKQIVENAENAPRLTNSTNSGRSLNLAAAYQQQAQAGQRTTTTTSNNGLNIGRIDYSLMNRTNNNKPSSSRAPPQSKHNTNDFYDENIASRYIG
eukprot:UN03097